MKQNEPSLLDQMENSTDNFNPGDYGIEIINSNEKEVINFERFITLQNECFSRIKEKIELGKNFASNSNTENGIFEDLQIEHENLSNLWNKFVEYFNTPPTEDEKKAINTTAIMKSAINELKEFETHLKTTNLEEKMKTFSTSFENFSSAVEAKLSSSTKTYNSFLDNFVNEENKKLQNYKNQVNDSLSFSRSTLMGVIAFFSITGLILGASFIFTFYKYQEYKKLDANVVTIAKSMKNIELKKSNIIIHLNKDVKISSDKNGNKQIILKRR